ncbi:MAG: hypothetical protein SH850_15620 [Planctomycetaceae bacterium]|nr:hypothetical protein [Planctomycetaceae bacterium]
MSKKNPSNDRPVCLRGCIRIEHPLWNRVEYHRVATPVKEPTPSRKRTWLVWLLKELAMVMIYVLIIMALQ